MSDVGYFTVTGVGRASSSGMRFLLRRPAFVILCIIDEKRAYHNVSKGKGTGRIRGVLAPGKATTDGVP